MVLAYLLLGLSTRAIPAVHPMWTIRVHRYLGPLDCRIDGGQFVVGNECYSLASGNHIDGRPSAPPVNEIPPHFIEQVRDAVLRVGKTELHVIKDTGRMVIGYDDGYQRLIEVDRDSPDRPVSIPYPFGMSSRMVSGDLSTGYLVGSSGLPDRNYVLSRLFFLSPLRVSPLSYFRFYDARQLSRCLGVVQRKGDKTNYDLQRQTPDAPLACGNAYTGQVYWRRIGFKYGRWMTPRWVLAHSDDSMRWAVLDGRSGRVVIPDIPHVRPLTWEEGVVSDLHGHFIFLLPDGDGKSTTISAFELREK